MATPCFPVSGDVGDLECQTIPIGLKPYPSAPWTWLEEEEEEEEEVVVFTQSRGSEVEEDGEED